MDYLLIAIICLLIGAVWGMTVEQKHIKKEIDAFGKFRIGTQAYEAKESD